MFPRGTAHEGLRNGNGTGGFARRRRDFYTIRSARRARVRSRPLSTGITIRHAHDDRIEFTVVGSSVVPPVDPVYSRTRSARAPRIISPLSRHDFRVTNARPGSRRTTTRLADDILPVRARTRPKRAENGRAADQGRLRTYREYSIRIHPPLGCSIDISEFLDGPPFAPDFKRLTSATFHAVFFNARCILILYCCIYFDLFYFDFVLLF